MTRQMCYVQYTGRFFKEREIRVRKKKKIKHDREDKSLTLLVRK